METSHIQSELRQNEEDEFAASRQFLEMVHHDEKPGPKLLGGRLYAYVITLQGEWRFTETGPEFPFQFVSKHSMHSDISNEVACAGEFFIRRRRRRREMRLSDVAKPKPLVDGEPSNECYGEKHKGFEAPGYGSRNQGNPDNNNNSDNDDGHGDRKLNNSTHERPNEKSILQDSVDISKKPSHKTGRSRDPRNFVLIIDNDSGTYRPDPSVLPSLQVYLERNLPGLKVKAMAYDDERLRKWKEDQKPKKRVTNVKKIVQESNNESSSDEDNIGFYNP